MIAAGTIYFNIICLIRLIIPGNTIKDTSLSSECNILSYVRSWDCCIFFFFESVEREVSDKITKTAFCCPPATKTKQNGERSYRIYPKYMPLLVGN